MSRQVILLAVLAKHHNVSENKPRPDHVNLERAGPAPDDVPFLFIGTMVAFYSMNMLPICLARFCIIGHHRMPCRRHVTRGVSIGVTKRYSQYAGVFAEV